MNDGPPEGTRVGVVGGPPAVGDAVSAGGGHPIVGDAGTVVGASPSAVVAVGEGALVDLVRVGVEIPVLPVSAPTSVRPVSASAVEDAVASVLAGEFVTVEYPLLAVEGPGTAGRPPRALFDVTLVTDEPARISEYAVLNGGNRISTFRADGVVAATPAGSTGYARAAAGPILAPGTDVLAVVPISPFTTDAAHWVLPAGGVGLVVERDETPVDLVLDGHETGTVDAGTVLDLSADGALTVAVVDSSADFFD